MRFWEGNRTGRPGLQNTRADAKSSYDFSKLWLGSKMKVSEVSAFFERVGAVIAGVSAVES